MGFLQGSHARKMAEKREAENNELETQTVDRGRQSVSIHIVEHERADIGGHCLDTLDSGSEGAVTLASGPKALRCFQLHNIYFATNLQSITRFATMSRASDIVSLARLLESLGVEDGTGATVHQGKKSGTGKGDHAAELIDKLLTQLGGEQFTVLLGCLSDATGKTDGERDTAENVIHNAYLTEDVVDEEAWSEAASEVTLPERFASYGAVMAEVDTVAARTHSVDKRLRSIRRDLEKFTTGRMLMIQSIEGWFHSDKKYDSPITEGIDYKTHQPHLNWMAFRIDELVKNLACVEELIDTIEQRRSLDGEALLPPSDIWFNDAISNVTESKLTAVEDHSRWLLAVAASIKRYLNHRKVAHLMGHGETWEKWVTPTDNHFWYPDMARSQTNASVNDDAIIKYGGGKAGIPWADYIDMYMYDGLGLP